MRKSQMKLETLVGDLYLEACEDGLSGIWFGPMGSPFEETPMLVRAARELAEYFAGERRDFSVPRAVSVGTPFQRRVWEELRRIPYGATISYAELAQRIGKPKAMRAVGSANGRNPVSIMVPCHRVVATGGGLGGYGGGLERKLKLLRLERAPGYAAAHEVRSLLEI